MAYFTAVILLGLGLFTRVAAVLTWFLHWTLMNTGESTNYGVDLYAHAFLFYLMWMPSGGAWSLDSLRLGRAEPSSGARLGLRVLQLHLCITYLCSAIEKASGIQWWNGELLWRAFSLPVYRQFDMSWLANWPHLSQAMGISSLFLEMFYCVFIWPRRTRAFWVASMIGLHLGIALLLGLHLFGILMSILTLAIFGFSAEPTAENAAVVFYDGGCAFCSRTVRELSRLDRRRRLAFASLQSELGLAALRETGQNPDRLETIVVQRSGRFYTRSAAILEIARLLPAPWPVLAVADVVPLRIRNALYDAFARNRHGILQQGEICPIPNAEMRRELNQRGLAQINDRASRIQIKQ